MKRIGKVMLASGLMILAAVFMVAAIGYRRVRLPILYRADVEVGVDEVAIIEFRSNSTGIYPRLYVHVEVYPIIVGPAKTYPLLAITMVDEEGLRMIENNQTPSYLYIRAVGVENSTFFELKDIKPGVYYLLFSNAIPEKAELKVTVIDEWGEFIVDHRLLYLLIFLGVVLVVASSILSYRRFRYGRARLRSYRIKYT